MDNTFKKTVKNGGIDGQGRDISYEFNTPAPKIQPTEIKTQTQYKSSPNFSKGLKAPQVSLKTGQEDTDKIGNFLKYQSDRRNANYMKDYDIMNLNRENQSLNRQQNHSQFIKKLAQTKNDNKLNRQQKESFFNQNMTNSNQQFDRSLDLKQQQYKYQNAVKNVMTPYQKATLYQNGINNRTKNFTDDDFMAMLPREVADEIDTGGRAYLQAKQQYLNNGTIPKFRQGGQGNTWYDTDYEIDPQQAHVAQAPQNAPQQQNNATDTPEARAYKRWVMAKNKQIMNENTSY